MRAFSFRLRADPAGRRGVRTLRAAASLRIAITATWLTLSILCGCDPAEPSRSMLLATTTSVRDSGLLDALLPEFTKRTGIEVRVIAVGTGAALRMGREGDADLLLTHAPTAEQVLVDTGIVRRRTPFMENHFVIAGPAADPAGIKSLATPEAALQAIAQSRAAWVSRADDSGTHKREVALWKTAGLSPNTSWEGLLHTGSGMGLSLQVAGEKRAYILTDIGTFLAFRERVDLVSLSTPSESLRNVYSLLQLDASNFDHALKTDDAEVLEDYFLSLDTQRKIGVFGQQRFGRAVFAPLHLSHDESE